MADDTFLDGAMMENPNKTKNEYSIICDIGSPITYKNLFDITYNGPGSTLAKRINEYGMMIIGVVGNATYGCDGAIGGLFGVSIVLWADKSAVLFTGFAIVDADAVDITLR